MEDLRVGLVHGDSTEELLEENWCMYVHTYLYGKLHTNSRKISQTTPRIKGPLIQK